MKVRKAVLILVSLLNSVGASAYDFDRGNAAVDVAIPTIAPVIFTEVSPSGGDATLVLRVTTLVTNAWFDATVPYAAPAVGVYSHLPHRPADEAATNANLNIALLHASYQVLIRLLPDQRAIWRTMLSDVGLDPDDTSTDLSSPVGIGNVAGVAVARGRERDGMNQLGDHPDQSHNPTPYLDTTGYRPVNTAYKLKNPSRWQPDLQRLGTGIYKIQQFVTPQYATTEPYSYPDPRAFRVPKPKSSDHRRRRAYKSQADAVLEASAGLDDEQKMLAELFDNKIESLGFSAVFAALSRGLSLREFIELDFLTNMAAHDAGIVVWKEKRRYDAVRPFSAIRHLYRGDPVTAWGGPGKGTVEDLPADQWRSYLEEADHPEYPSASACFCRAHSRSARLYLGSDALNWTVSRAAGSSRVEPGLTPAQDLDLEFPTWSGFAEACGESRVWAGVHFRAAVEASEDLCDVFGELAYSYLNELVSGEAELRPPSEPLSTRSRRD